MTSTLIGIVTFGNFQFTLKTIMSCVNTVPQTLNFFVIVGKPEDNQTHQWLTQAGIPHILHAENKGFPASVNDIYDYAFKQKTYDNLIIIGNDVIAYPHTINNMIELANSSDYEAISTTELNVKDFVLMYPQAQSYFHGGKYIIKNLDHEIWNLYSQPKEYEIFKGLIDIHNLCLYKKSVFEKVGYLDVNFYPAYFEDNDLVRRMGFADIKDCFITSRYFHFWSRTIHQEVGGSNNKYFELNKNFYSTKWGGEVRKERFDIPFNGKIHELSPQLKLRPVNKIDSRENELDIIHYWRDKVR